MARRAGCRSDLAAEDDLARLPREAALQRCRAFVQGGVPYERLSLQPRTDREGLFDLIVESPALELAALLAGDEVTLPPVDSGRRIL